jgi:hypothetical protein
MSKFSQSLVSRKNFEDVLYEIRFCQKILFSHKFSRIFSLLTFRKLFSRKSKKIVRAIFAKMSTLFRFNSVDSFPKRLMRVECSLPAGYMLFLVELNVKQSDLNKRYIAHPPGTTSHALELNQSSTCHLPSSAFFAIFYAYKVRYTNVYFRIRQYTEGKVQDLKCNSY